MLIVLYEGMRGLRGCKRGCGAIPASSVIPDTSLIGNPSVRRCSVMPGFVPAAEPLWFGQSAQTHVGRTVPFGFAVRFANTGGAQARGACPESSRRAQTMPVFSPVLAIRLSHTTWPETATQTDSAERRIWLGAQPCPRQEFFKALLMLVVVSGGSIFSLTYIR